MLHTLRNLVPAQLQKQAVMIKRTFIEVVDSRPDNQSSGCQRKRYFSDSAVLIPPPELEVFSDACSTGEEDEEKFVDADSSDCETNPELQREHSAPQEGGQPVAATDAASPRAPRKDEGAGDTSRSVRFCMGGLERESDGDADAACNEGGNAADSELRDDGDHQASPRDEGDLSWRHLRTISFSEAATPAMGSRVAAVAELLSSSETPSQPPAAQVAEAHQPAQALQPQPQFIAVLVPAVIGQQCGAVAAPAAGAAAAAPPPAPALAQQPPAQAAAPAAAAPQPAVAAQRRTTLMLRNVPLNYTRERLLKLLDRQGLAGLYDFAYLPIDFRTGSSLGYAFVNAADPSAVQRLWHALDGFTRWSVPSKKKCSVSWNDPHQGLDMNVERYRNSPVMHPSVPDDYKPIVFSGGVRVAYPPPTKSIKAPRLRK